MQKEEKAAFKRRMKALKVPEGFTLSSEEKSWAWHKLDDKTVTVFTLLKPDDTEIKFDQSGCGHTRYYIVGKGWRSFDRTGVCDSFYHAKLYGKDSNDCDLNRIVSEQLDRIAERREYHKTAVPVPGIPFTVAPAAVEVLKKDLAKRGHIMFTPSGFGTGYMVTKKPQRQLRFGETRAKPEMETFFGISPLYVSTQDCD